MDIVFTFRQGWYRVRKPSFGFFVCRRLDAVSFGDPLVPRVFRTPCSNCITKPFITAITERNIRRVPERLRQDHSTVRVVLSGMIGVVCRRSGRSVREVVVEPRGSAPLKTSGLVSTAMYVRGQSRRCASGQAGHCRLGSSILGSRRPGRACACALPAASGPLQAAPRAPHVCAAFLMSSVDLVGAFSAHNDRRLVGLAVSPPSNQPEFRHGRG